VTPSKIKEVKEEAPQF